jgi:enamine deaminase RidA (YjgF/YER057c/UK114 family)
VISAGSKPLPDRMYVLSNTSLCSCCRLELISTLKRTVGDLDRVKRIVKVNGFIQCTTDFTQLPAVLNGCSNLLGEVFEERGVHARSAVGVSSLPLGVPVEIDLLALVEMP